MNVNQKMKCIHQTKRNDYPTIAQSMQFCHETVLKQTHMTIKRRINVQTNYKSI